jgi:hypothetical protein
MIRVPCIKCGNQILKITAAFNGGLCGPCKKGGGHCKSCGKQIWYSTKNGEFLCNDCSQRQRETEVAERTGINWSTPEEIDWTVFIDAMVDASRTAFEEAARKHPGRTVTSFVIAYRFGASVSLEPCLTFDNGDYLNLIHDDNEICDRLLTDLEPFVLVFNTLSDYSPEEVRERYRKLLHVNIPALEVRLTTLLNTEDFGFKLAPDCEREVKDY